MENHNELSDIVLEKNSGDKNQKLKKILLISRSEERRVGKECVSPCRIWVLPLHRKNKETVSEAKTR